MKPDRWIKRHKILTIILAFAVLLVFLAMLPNRICLKILRCELLFNSAHIVSHLFLTLALCVYFRMKREWFGMRLTAARVLGLSFLISAVLSGITEGIQIWVPSRHAEWSDFGMDLAGGIAGILAYAALRRRVLNRVQAPPVWIPESAPIQKI